ncbi:MAG TPA: hypothetical protein VGW11_02490 [Solirubrobacteraceae bacterium]|nr:hypothetical protein [Solirubrobacteraceae bacterium]
MRLRGARTTGVAVAVGAVVAAGCGGEEGPTQEEFAQQANAICERHTAPIREAAGRLLAGGELPDPREFMQLTRETIIPELTAQVNELRQLEAPEAQSEEFQRFVESSAAARERIAQDPRALTNPSNFEQVNQQAQQLGLSQCRVGPG